MTDAALSIGRPAGLAALRAPAQRLLDGMVVLWIFAGGLVVVEPSPYEVIFLSLLPVAIVAGLGLYRSTTGLLLAFAGFIPFAMLSALLAPNTPVLDGLVFVLVTAFLILTAYFAANYVAADPIRRMRLVVAAYTAIAIICAMIGLAAYLGALPGEGVFLLYGRAKATFKDPNVYGPFLVLPAMFALQRVLLSRGRAVIWGAAIFLILFVGVFVSFSRAAWGHFLGSAILVYALCFALEAFTRERVRMVLMGLAGVGVLLVALVGLVSIPAVGDLLATRLESQAYDTGESGRFGRQGYALDFAITHPFGLGPLEFRNSRVTEEPHNTYVNVLLNYGWGGGFIYFVMVAMTLWRGWMALVQPSPYRRLLIPVLGTYSVLVLQAAIIDTDHWRHYFLLVGLIWGLTAAMKADPKPRARRDEALV